MARRTRTGPDLSRLLLPLLAVGGLTLAGCADAPGDEAAADGAAEGATDMEAPAELTVAQAYPDPAPAPYAGANVVDVIAEDFAFDAPEQIPSGWTTFRLENTGEETHFLLVTRIPDGRTIEDYELDLGVPFGEIWYRIRDEGLDKMEALEALGPALPEWYVTGAEVVGGPGMVVPGGVSMATMELEPGTYILECFLKTAEGEFHWMEGMVREIEVTEERSEAAPPEASVRLTLTLDGIAMEGQPSAGTNVVELTFAEQPEAGFGNDVHVVRLDGEQSPDVSPEALVPWMDAFNVDGLRNPAPAPFVGGSHERVAGRTVYFTVDLLPGRYAWITENSDLAGGLYQEFTVE